MNDGRIDEIDRVRSGGSLQGTKYEYPWWPPHSRSTMPPQHKHTAEEGDRQPLRRGGKATMEHDWRRPAGWVVLVPLQASCRTQGREGMLQGYAHQG